ncbi:hypothetical protein [Lactiplantibacillus plantarum]|uniref:hypothetical protein n=1 Tax=Lactiplantibacillus plantarum TaxID=1590 RepID=UPI000A17B121|nr:hypothetical protein [Lactiplantibacillus plantarum]ARK35655.1 hypothetical protein B5726_15290 [Lactiplantibacillus plantarum]QAR74666.1 hypothetical protein EQH94_00300 [Lactiplantibacillus plantarum]QAS31188.1 hypothetical protein EQK45_15195 [Lactiplantibacillus plantarum]QBA75973.1 hypothetical protein EVE91_00295 [Lactiplantibacillus plantarum]RWZ49393.1 hypothetical protein EQJ06_15160 [Lactiplantibacillus plantarum]
MAKLWHRLFVVVFLVLSVLVIKNTYQKSVDQEQDKKDVSEGTLKKQSNVKMVSWCFVIIELLKII